MAPLPTMFRCGRCSFGCFVRMVVSWTLVLGWAGALEISEFLADNQNGLQDEDGETSDWIELHNNSPLPVDTAGFQLTDDPLHLDKWPIPASMLPAGGYLVIFASGKNRTGNGSPWHTNFSLKSSGEYLALSFGRQIVQEFAPKFPPQLPDVSYGITPPQFMGDPTPGLPNDPAPPGPLPVTVLPAGGTFTSSFSATLSVTTPGAEIRYTIDGTSPTSTSALYAGPIAISSTTRLHARAFVGSASGPVTGGVWVKVGANLVAYQSPLPILILENFNTGNVPIKLLGPSDGSGIQQVAQQAASWIMKERAAGVTLMSYPAQLTGEIGIRGRGYFSSQWTQKPYSIEPRNAAGGTISASPLGMPSNNDWILYYPDPGEFKDYSMLNNAFSYQLSRNVGRYAARFRFVEVFLNTNGGDLQLADRKGVYLLMEKISRGAERLDFSPLSADGTTGGCILSVNRMDAIPETGWPAMNGATTPQFFHTSGPNRILQTPANVKTVVGDDIPSSPAQVTSKAYFNFDQPNGYRINSAQRAAVELWFKNFENVLYDDAKWLDPVLGYRSYLKVKDFVGCYLLHNFVRHTDAMYFSLYPWLGNDRQLRLGPIWDTNTGGYADQGAPEASPFWHSTSLWFPRLFSDPDFLQDYIDLWSEWRRAGMTDVAIAALIDAQAAEITPAKAVAQGVPNADEWMKRLTTMKTWVHGRAAYFDATFAPVPSISVATGNVPSGTIVQLTASGQDMATTSDGTDPRMPGGGVSPAAFRAVSLSLVTDTRIMSRSLTTGTYPWSGPRVATYAVDAEPATAENLRISEIHYHPAVATPEESAAGFTNREDFEFLELTNIGAQKISLLDVRAVRINGAGIDFDFSTGSHWTLQPGARLVIARNAKAMLARYGASVMVAGTFEGNLSNQGETLTLQTSTGQVLQQVTFSDLAPWPTAADGAGFSLTWRGGDPNLLTQWRTSGPSGGTPGTHDGVPYVGNTSEAWAAYALGPQPLVQISAAEFVFTPPPGADAADYELEESGDLQNWEPSSWNYVGESHLPNQPAQRRWAPFAEAITPPLFLRLRAMSR